jgi:hypothetical protein
LKQLAGLRLQVILGIPRIVIMPLVSRVFLGFASSRFEKSVSVPGRRAARTAFSSAFAD